MNAAIVTAIIGAIATVVAAVVGRSEFVDQLFRRHRVYDLRGEWKSTWSEPDQDGSSSERTETITITKIRGNRVEGFVQSTHYEGRPCSVEGFFSGRFLLLIWYPTKTTRKRLIDDYGCYFLEKKPDGSFKGECVGFFEHLDKVARFEHTVRRIGTA